MTPMQVDRRKDGTTVLILIGRLDAETCTDLEGQLDSALAEKPRAIAFDLKRVEYISSAGVRLILKARNYMARLGRRVVAANASAQVKRVFAAVQNLAVDQLFDNDADLDAYLALLQADDSADPDPITQA